MPLLVWDILSCVFAIFPSISMRSVHNLVINKGTQRSCNRESALKWHPFFSFVKSKLPGAFKTSAKIDENGIEWFTEQLVQMSSRMSSGHSHRRMALIYHLVLSCTLHWPSSGMIHLFLSFALQFDYQARHAHWFPFLQRCRKYRPGMILVH